MSLFPDMEKLDIHVIHVVALIFFIIMCASIIEVGRSNYRDEYLLRMVEVAATSNSTALQNAAAEMMKKR